MEEIFGSSCKVNKGKPVIVTCQRSCSNKERGKCKCGTMVYKDGIAYKEDELTTYGIGCSKKSLGIPLTKLTALVRQRQGIRFCLHVVFFSFRLEHQTFQNLMEFLPGMQMFVHQINAGKWF